MKSLLHFIATTLITTAGSVYQSSASISPVILNPGPGTLIADSLNISVNVNSTYQVTNVTAKFGPVTTNLFYSTVWTNVIDTSSLARGSYTLQVVAQDVFGNTGQALVQITLDRPPVLNVIAPLWGSVATSNLEVEVVASDDDPVGTRIDVYGATSHYIGTNVGYFSIPGFNGLLTVTATDSAGQVVAVNRAVYFEPSTNLVEAFSAPGPLLDFSGSRLLYASIPDPPQPPVGQLLDTASGQVITAPPFWAIVGVQYETPTQAWVSASSAVLVYAQDHIAPSPYNTLEPPYLVALQGTNFVAVSWDWSLPEKVVNGVALILQSLFDFNCSTNGCSLYVGTSLGSPSYEDLGRNDIVFVDTNGISKSSPINSSDICSRVVTQVSSRTGFCFHPVTDDTNVVFQWGTNIIANVAAEDIVLASWSTNSNSQYIQYAANGGWIAFSTLDITLQRQLWTRSPAGRIEQRTFFGSSSSLESLNDDGILIFTVPGQGSRYLSVSGAQPVWINSMQGLVKWDAGIPYVIIGRTAFRTSLGTLSIDNIDGKLLRINLRSPNGLRYVIQKSDDLLAWRDSATVTNSTGLASITNSLANFAGFYRAVLSQ